MIQRGYSICKAAISDTESVHRLLWDERNEIPLSNCFNDEKHKNWVTEQCQKGHVLIVKYGTQIVGVEILAEQELKYLAIHEDHRRNGLAKCLVRRAVNVISEQSKLVQVQTLKSNQKMGCLLNLEGFKIHDIGSPLFIKGVEYLIWRKSC